VLEGIKVSLTPGAILSKLLSSLFIRRLSESLALATSLGPQHSHSARLTTQRD